MLKRFIFLQEDKISEASTAALEVGSSLEHSQTWEMRLNRRYLCTLHMGQCIPPLCSSSLILISNAPYKPADPRQRAHQQTC